MERVPGAPYVFCMHIICIQGGACTRDPETVYASPHLRQRMIPRGGIAGTAVGIAKIVFFVALVLFLISLVAGGFRSGFGRRLWSHLSVMLAVAPPE